MLLKKEEAEIEGGEELTLSRLIREELSPKVRGIKSGTQSGKISLKLEDQHLQRARNGKEHVFVIN